MKSKLFKGTSPCGNCPYRKDVPKQHWSVDEFKDLMKSEQDYIGKVYGCHKANGTVCKGWLINQDKRGFPSLALRMALSKHRIDRDYLDKLKSAKPMFNTVEAMCKANYPKEF